MAEQEQPAKEEEANKDAQQDDEKKEENASAEEAKPATGVNFTGSWELVSNENLDEFMKSQGIGFMKRKLMSMASITLHITHKGDTMKVNAKLPIGEINEELIFDGSEKTTKNPMGDEVKMSAKWSDDSKTVLIVNTHNLKNDNKVEMKRTKPNENEMKDTMKNQKGVTMTRTFKRKAIAQ